MSTALIRDGLIVTMTRAWPGWSWAEALYERAVFGGEADALDEANTVLDGVEADLALARGRNMHTRFLLRRDSGQADEEPGELELFERAAELYRALGDTRGEAEALFWIGCFHQVVRRDNDVAVGGD
ncbi:MAG: hypothetical protein ACRDPY_27780 [Streptosporangiaceae bacterium]